MPGLQLTHGLRDGELIHVSQVPSGLACACHCPACKAPLVARKGKIVAHHFAHYRSDPCKDAVETALHLAAKDILREAGHIQLPALHITFNSYKKDVALAPAKTYVLDNVRLEQRSGQIVPDVIATVGGHDLLIEIFVTHRVDDEKRRLIREMGVSAMEIDLSTAPRELSESDLMQWVVSRTDNKHWLHSVRVEREKARMLAVARRMPTIQRGLAVHVDHCPIRARVWRGKAYANFIDDCVYCEHCLNIGHNNSYIDCNGHP